VAHDFSPDELRKAYRAASLHYHPDKRATGSSSAFARVAAAHAALSDPDQRRAFDTGHGLPASNASPEAVKDGLGPFLWDEVEELYFPEAVKKNGIVLALGARRCDSPFFSWPLIVLLVAGAVLAVRRPL
jgi:curved DNA-binding protein CbpA